MTRRFIHPISIAAIVAAFLIQFVVAPAPAVATYRDNTDDYPGSNTSSVLLVGAGCAVLLVSLIALSKSDKAEKTEDEDEEQATGENRIHQQVVGVGSSAHSLPDHSSTVSHVESQMNTFSRPVKVPRVLPYLGTSKLAARGGRCDRVWSGGLVVLF